MKYNKWKERRSTPVLKPPYFSNATKNICLAPRMGRCEGAAHEWEPQLSSLAHKHRVPVGNSLFGGEDVPSAHSAAKANTAPSQRDNRILARLSLWSRLCLCWLPPSSRTPRKAPCSFYSCDIGWERDLPLSWNWKDLKTSHYQKVYKGWDFESVLREAKNLSDINGN